MGVVAAFVARVLLVPSPCVPRLLRQALSSVFSNHSNLLERFTKLATSSSIKTVKSDFFSQEYGLDIKAFLRRRQAEKTTNFAIIPVYCGFGTFV
jgi:hypothetical protein